MFVELGIGGYAVSNRLDDVIRTYALGSCVAVVIYHPVHRVLGMAHVALPDSGLNPAMAGIKPGYFADTALDLLLDTAAGQFGCPEREMDIRLYGGSDSVRKTDVFQIGARNIEAVERCCFSRNLGCSKVDTGGNFSRSVEADVATGTVRIQSYPLAF